MRNNIICYVALIVLACFLSCEESSKCEYAQRIAVEAGCYDPAKGLKFVALGNGDYTALNWEIHVLRNFSSGWTPNDIEINQIAGESFTVPDSILLDNIHILATVVTDCDGTYLHSKYFSFIRIRSANCTLWVENEI